MPYRISCIGFKATVQIQERDLVGGDSCLTRCVVKPQLELADVAQSVTLWLPQPQFAVVHVSE
jgi:hypothetical protein